MNDSSTAPLNNLDEAALSKFHGRIVITAGMGFFTDAYDLFIIGVVTAILAPVWHLTIEQLALLNGASLAAAALGCICFGSLSDRFGRRKIYGFEVLILFIGAILSAVSPNFMWLLASRILVGFGIGGDYPSSAVVASEYANRKNRGFIVLLVFAMQAVGLVVGPFLAGLLLAVNISPDWVWRILLGLGAIPAASVFYLRKTIQETPRYLMSKKAPYVVSRAVSELAGNPDGLQWGFKQQSLFAKKWVLRLVITSSAWFLLDVAFYGNGISSVLILKQLNPSADLLNHTLIAAVIFLVFAVPGYYLAAKYVDIIGRKVLQILGFTVMAICYALIALVPHITEHVVWFLLVFGISFFFVNFGPNTTTFLIPSEIYPTSIRARAHGISAAMGKVGAFLGAFFLPIVLKSTSLQFTIGLMALVCVVGVLVSFFVPDMKNLSLDETEIKISSADAAS